MSNLQSIILVFDYKTYNRVGTKFVGFFEPDTEQEEQREPDSEGFFHLITTINKNPTLLSITCPYTEADKRFWDSYEDNWRAKNLALAFDIPLKRVYQIRLLKPSPQLRTRGKSNVITLVTQYHIIQLGEYVENQYGIDITFDDSSTINNFPIRPDSNFPFAVPKYNESSPPDPPIDPPINPPPPIPPPPPP